MPDARPNIIICQCDQLRAFEVGCYGNEVIRTPHIDRLASGGVWFENAFTNNPVCTPARSCLLSGQYARTCAGWYGNANLNPPRAERIRLVDPTLPEVLRHHGYHTALIGKWHIDPQPNLVGFESALYPRYDHRNYGQTYYTDTLDSFVVEDFGPAYEADRVREFLEKARPEPFFLYYNIGPPHQPIGPHQMPPEYSEIYDPAEMPLRPNTTVDGTPSHDEHWFKIYQSADYYWRFKQGLPELASDRLPNGFDLRHLTALYYGAATCVDDQVGRLVEGLEATGHVEDTIVVFLSDHGDNLGSHGLFNKDVLLEESVRIPLIFRWPGTLLPGVNATQLAQTIDLMPTLLRMTGIEIPASVQGESLDPFLEHPGDAAPRSHVFIETDANQVGIRTATHLYGFGIDPFTHDVVEDPVYFFDLEKDPFQVRNMAGTNEQPQLGEALRSLLHHWHGHTPWLQDLMRAGEADET